MGLFNKKKREVQEPDVYADWPHRYIIHHVDRADADIWTANCEYPDPLEGGYEEALNKAREAFEQGDFSPKTAHLVEKYIQLKNEELRLSQLQVSRTRRARDAAHSKEDKRLTVQQYQVLQNARKRELERLGEEINRLKNNKK